MAGVTLGVFTDREHAEMAINDLQTAGYNPRDISVITREIGDAQALARDTGANVTEGAVEGATTGSVLGGLAGLLIGIGAITLPGIGALLIGGPLAAALGLTGAAATTVSGAVSGALAGGLVGGLVGLGVPEETARVYEEKIKEGAILLAVPSLDGTEGQARRIMEAHGADQTRYLETDKAKWRL